MSKPIVMLASPFFTPDQVNSVRALEAAIEACGYTCLSASRDGTVIAAESTWKDRRKGFTWSTNAIDSCQLVVANIDDRDQGTSHEMGYAYGKDKPILTISMHDYDVNLMLACCIIGHLKSLAELGEVLELLREPLMTNDAQSKLEAFAIINAKFLYRGRIE
jgi:nucleoside 2-deoxyribosyltransferase